MGKTTGFLEFDRQLPSKDEVANRLKNYNEFVLDAPEEQINNQAARCMNCGVPTCHAGCPLGNIIPDFNDLVYRKHWKKALQALHSTNNFPEFTGRLCPAPCEEACVLGINEPAVTIEEIEKQIVEKGWSEGWIVPEPPKTRTDKTVAVIGSGPAGLAAAQQLNRAGHTVTVFERSDRVGGLLRYGIPDFKMEKSVIDRRLEVLKAEGITFKTNAEIGVNVSTDELKQFDATVIAIGSTVGRGFPIEGADLDGVHLAMEFLPLQNKVVAGDSVPDQLMATDKDVIVIGGGDTGSDCIGTSNRHGANSVTNFELLPKPPVGRPENQPWPYYPMKLRTSTSHDEGVHREWSILTKRFNGDGNGTVKSLTTAYVEWITPEGGGRPEMKEVDGTEKDWPADLILLAMGFVHPETDTFVKDLGCELDGRGNVQVDANWMSSVPGVFAAGDAQRGQSLIVWAIADGREAARSVDTYLMGKSDLPTKGTAFDLPRV